MANVEIRDAYVGERQKQIRHGYGTYSYENKYFKYEGEWQDGQKHGHGKLSMADNSYYEGAFEKGEIIGYGYRYFGINGNSYSGDFYMGELHGKGTMNYKAGDVYEGQWNRNRREGYGIYRMNDQSVYKGYLYNDMRHGEGIQVYSNGDQYDGNWVMDKRQGHGALRCRDGSIFDGQWHNDLYNGQGTFTHCSGMSYEGLWVNGMPVKMATKLVLTCEPQIEVIQGTPFNIEIHTVDEDGETIEDMGRTIQISAGFKYIPPVAPEVSKLSSEDGSAVSQSNTATSQRSASNPPGNPDVNPDPNVPTDPAVPTATATGQRLFDAIEDAEEIPMETPFGYEVVSYPLTDQFPFESFEGAFSRQQTNLSENVIQENEEQDTTATDRTDETAQNKSQKDEDVNDVKPKEEGSQRVGSVDNEEQGSEVQGATVELADDASMLVEEMAPPVQNQRSECGIVVFNNLVLTAPPPMYRPFAMLDSAKTKTKSGSKSKDLEEKRASSRKDKAMLGDERFARQGEYVIIVKDVTDPPFLGKNLEPVFLLVNHIVPKKRRSPVVKPKKEGPKL